jgi:putative tryptophan/tyrosine transport system substrate-binding protein
MGLVASLNRPGGNLTGVATLSIEVEAKQLELLRSVLPAATSMGALIRPSNPNAEAQSRVLAVAAQSLGLRLRVVTANTEQDFDAAFARLAELKADALIISTDGLFISHGERLAALALQHAMPAIFQVRAFADAGGLMSYGASLTESSRQVGIYAGRVLNGEKPADLPVLQATRLELIINLKTASALGVAVPPSVLASADEVIE